MAQLEQAAQAAQTRELEDLRKLFDGEGIDGYVVRKSDAHFNEYIEKADDAVEYLTKFTGSNGTALILRTSAILFTDARYFTQAEKELPGDVLLARMGEDKSLQETILDLPRGTRIGVNPHLVYRFENYDRFIKEAGVQGIEVKYVAEDLVGKIWGNRPARLRNAITAMEGTGKSAQEKIEAVRARLGAVSSIVITAMDEVAWLFNLRGSDVEQSRLFYSFAFLSKDACILFADGKMQAEPSQPAKIEKRPYAAFYEFIKELPCNSVILSQYVNMGISHTIERRAVVIEKEVVSPLKAVKTKEEIEGLEEGNVRDAVVLCRLFGSLERDLSSGTEIGEEDVARRLLGLKQEDGDFIAPSFDTISAYGPNAAIIHYKPKDNSVKLGAGSLFLLDSGSQYSFGTTDITRTVCFGDAKKEHKRDYTLVIKGNMALHGIRFPKGYTGGALDTLARLPLWEKRLDFGHSTGHGVGHGLNVHEGPQAIAQGSRTKLLPGMTVTNEPGVYRKDEHGVRHEDLMVVEEEEKDGFLKFRNLTPVPLHLGLIDRSLLSESEVEYINSESARIRTLLGQRLAADAAGLAYLMKNTEQI